MRDFILKVIFVILNSVLFGNMYIKNDKVFEIRKNKNLTLLNFYALFIRLCIVFIAIVFPLIVINS